jgi:hypothetical protein
MTNIKNQNIFFLEKSEIMPKIARGIIKKPG